eukprot:CAMPEP_0172712376 /NCGR_PEP_ID=MMETSP1074-20121228/61060_1 /TAXON_ID=2916 /ORGANISM="Ceratium fusus, Strain PA161109" /LENGTH=162 /DNA_ID=CAMNT_0013536293 /DNA_START=51 /DNA_END=540 /DNA_ORIENTATION=+
MDDSNSSMNVGNKLGSRRSTRVNQAPGGTSSICLGGGHFAENVDDSQREQRANTCPFGVSRRQQEPADKGAARAGADARLHAAPFATGAATIRETQLDAAPFVSGAASNRETQFDAGFRPASGGRAPFATANNPPQQLVTGVLGAAAPAVEAHMACCLGSDM